MQQLLPDADTGFAVQNSAFCHQFFMVTDLNCCFFPIYIYWQYSKRYKLAGFTPSNPQCIFPKIETCCRFPWSNWKKKQEKSLGHGFPMILMNWHSVLEQTVCVGADSSRLVYSPKKSLLLQTGFLLLCFQQLLLVSVIQSCLVINICCSTAASDINTSVRVVASFIIRTVHLVQLGSSVSEQDVMVLQPFHSWSWILNLTVRCESFNWITKSKMFS